MLLEQTQLASVHRQQRAELGQPHQPHPGQLGCATSLSQGPVWNKNKKTKFLSRRRLSAQRDKECSCWYGNRKGLGGKSEAVPHQETRVVISAATALLHTGQVCTLGHYIFMWPVWFWVFFLIWVPTIGNKFDSLHNCYHFGELFFFGLLKTLYGMNINRANITLARGNSCYTFAWRERKKIFLWLLPATSSYFLDKSETTAGTDTCSSPSPFCIISNC